MNNQEKTQAQSLREASKIRTKATKPADDMEEEIGGRDGPEPTRYGDWEVDGKCTDF